MNQKEGVYSVVMSYLSEHGLTHDNESALQLSDEQRKDIKMILAIGFHEGKIDMTERARAKYNSVDKLNKEYVGGLLSNWLRKDLRLNGNVPHEIKSPGSRSGSGDAIVKNLKLLLKDPRLSESQRKQVEAQIAKRQSEIKAKLTPEINWEVLKGLDLDIDLT